MCLGKMLHCTLVRRPQVASPTIRLNVRKVHNLPKDLRYQLPIGVKKARLEGSDVTQQFSLTSLCPIRSLKIFSLRNHNKFRYVCYDCR